MPPPNQNVATPPKPTQLLAQPMPNPNNKEPQQQQVYATDPNQYPAYVVSISDIHLKSGTTLPTSSPLVITEMPNEGHIHQSVITSPVPSRPEQQESSNTPPFPQRLEEEPTKQKEELMFDIVDRLKNVFVKIPLFQAIKDVPISGKAIKEACLKKPGRKKKDPHTIHVVGQLEDLMLGKFCVPKYSNPGSPLVAVVINGVQFQNTLIDLGAAINVMTNDVMQKLNITNLRTTTTVLQLADSSTITPDGMVEDLVVTLDSWEYPTDFVILSHKATLGGYPIILGRSSLATIDAFIGCRLGDMTIFDGTKTKILALYSPTQPHLEEEHLVWLDIKEESDKVNTIQQLMMIRRGPFLQLQEEEDVLSNIL
ncbi:uncharacterized protein LOC131050994 [Cryptomeria japonica]|uniref:uncharacterized protein LOC131050994 n=1 Tax=Cryptomeria japonica TaxID=3369 RepID=UPI0027D9EB6E|nr:uncharacterized protein LOC131050994 [Cryptomeria japonica]